MMARRTSTRGSRPVAAVVAGVVLAALVVSCDASASSDDPTTVQVVASTSAWGSIAAAVGGGAVSVVSVISDPDQDPHSFEASARTLLAVEQADLLIENGGGYDDFMDSMIDSSDASAPVLNAVAISGYADAEGSPLNEHVWYDVPTVRRVAERIAESLSRLAPENARMFRSNETRLLHGLADLARREQAVAEFATGTGIAITEPVPLYMLEAMGLRNLTPPEFSEGIEEGAEASAGTLDETLDLYRDHAVAALIYNEQTSGAVTELVKDAADDAGVPVVGVTETLPSGDTYLAWMRHNVESIRQALLP